MEVVEFLQTLNKVSSQMEEKDQQKASSKVYANTMESLDQRIKQLEKQQFDVNKAIALGRGLWNKYGG